jgi:hypothetical protein
MGGYWRYWTMALRLRRIAGLAGQACSVVGRGRWPAIELEAFTATASSDPLKG